MRPNSISSVSAPFPVFSSLFFLSSHYAILLFHTFFSTSLPPFFQLFPFFFSLSSSFRFISFSRFGSFCLVLFRFVSFLLFFPSISSIFFPIVFFPIFYIFFPSFFLPFPSSFTLPLHRFVPSRLVSFLFFPSFFLSLSPTPFPSLPSSSFRSISFRLTPPFFLLLPLHSSFGSIPSLAATASVYIQIDAHHVCKAIFMLPPAPQPLVAFPPVTRRPLSPPPLGTSSRPSATHALPPL